MDDNELLYMTIGNRILDGIDEIVGRGPLQNLSLNQNTPPNIFGRINTSIKYDSRKIEVYFLAGSTDKEINQTYRDITRVIKTDENKEKIIFSDDKDVCWFGSLVECEIDQEVQRFARIKCTFECDPGCEDVKEREVVADSNNKLEILNDGTVDVYGVLYFTLSGGIKELTIKNEGRITQLKLKSESNLDGNWKFDMKARILYREDEVSMQNIDQFNTKLIVGKKDKFNIRVNDNTILYLDKPSNVKNFKVTFKRMWL